MLLAIIIVIIIFGAIGGWAGIGKFLGSGCFTLLFWGFLIWLIIQLIMVDMPH